jgi:hypothetical protein
MNNPLKLLQFALEKYPEKVELAPVRDLMLDSARKNDRRPAYVKLALPDELVKALRGAREGQDTVLLVRIPADVNERVDSRIVLPGEVG